MEVDDVVWQSPLDPVAGVRIGGLCDSAICVATTGIVVDLPVGGGLRQDGIGVSELSRYASG